MQGDERTPIPNALKEVLKQMMERKDGLRSRG